METLLGIVTAIEYKTDSANGKTDITLQVIINDSEDVQTVYWYSPCGSTALPLIDSTVIIIPITDSYKIGIAVDDGIDPEELEEGESLLYSLDDDGVKRGTVKLEADGTVTISSTTTLEETKSSIVLENTGNITLNEGEDWAVQYTALKSTIDQIKSDLNNAVSKFNSHTHTGTCPNGAVSTIATTTPATASTADMSSAKIESIRVP